MTAKTMAQSYTEQVHMVNHADLNGTARLFGGRLLSWIDMTAGFAARRHSGRNITTAAIDELRFIAPAYANDMVVLHACVTYTGRTSMEVRVCTYVEAPSGARRLINEAFVVIVALDENDRPAPVPPLRAETEEEERIMREAALRQQLRKERLQALKDERGSEI